MSFVHLHVHSHYSFLRGADGVDTLAQQAAGHGMPALALTDINGLYGAVPFQQACAKHGVRPIFGVQLVTPTHTCLALVKNDEGYRSLCRIITALQLSEADFDLPTQLAADRGGLIVISQDTALLAELIAFRAQELPNDHPDHAELMASIRQIRERISSYYRRVDDLELGKEPASQELIDEIYSRCREQEDLLLRARRHG